MGLFDGFRRLMGRRHVPERAAPDWPPPKPVAEAPVHAVEPRTQKTQAVAEMEFWNEDFDALDIEALSRIELPSLPAFALQAAKLARDPSTPVRKIADAIGCDPVLAARVLRAANSPLYGFERPVTTLRLAVTALGNNAINNLILIFATADVMKSKDPLSKRERTLWRHSMSVAFAAREIAAELRLYGGEEAFLCGLMHDIGKVFLMRHDPSGYEHVAEAEEEGDMLRRERDLFGVTHPVVGAAVAIRWGFPPEIVRPISLHHQPGEAQTSHTLVRMIDLADMLANANGYGLRPPDDFDLGLTESAIALDLGTEQLTAVWDRSQNAALETIHLFS